MDKSLLKHFWNCGDNEIIEFAIQRARLNRQEKDVIKFILDDCMTQEQTAERMNYSYRRVQEIWYSANSKLLNIPWVYAYAEYNKKNSL